MARTPLISIVVPTKDRLVYLESLVRTVLRSRVGDFELLVHDNSSEPGASLLERVGKDDARLRYVYDPTPMSITENFTRGVALARGEYVCMIGDDDGVTDSIVDLAAWLKHEGIEAAAVPVATYLWPGVSSALDGAQQQGVLRLPAYSRRTTVIRASVALDRVLASGGIRIGDLPSVYQGVISRDALERLRSLAGSYFPGPSPDMANAVGLSAVVDRFARVSFPVVISGSCPPSGAAQGARRAHHGEIDRQTFLPPGTAERWPPQVPYYFSGPTVWAATLIHALTATGRSNQVRKLRFDRLYGACAVLNPGYRTRVQQARISNTGLVSAPQLVAAMAWIWSLRARALVGNLTRRLVIPSGGVGQTVGLADIGEVIFHIDRMFGRFRPMV